jgi:dihydrofolate synthase/folylpolyglutamate synthase
MTNISVDAVQQRLDRLASLHPKMIDLSLGRTLRVLSALGDPHLRLPPVIHVAGTNGKGSTVALLRAFALAAGLRPHVYTSPHLVRFNERIELAGAQISDEALLAALDRAEAANAGAEITFFEIVTAAAFAAFAETPADILLLETGLGGRLDSTNVVPHPIATIVTPVSMDHREYLGDDLLGIAREKAGIFKRGVPAIIGQQSEAVRPVLTRAAESVGAPALVFGMDFRTFSERGRLVYEDDKQLFDLPLPRLRGAHQVANAGPAIAAALIAGMQKDAIAEGLTRATWPARLQRLSEGPLAEIAARAGAELWLDGAHNAAGALALAAAIADLDSSESKPLALVCGIMGNKDHTAVTAPFAGLARLLVATPITGQPAGADPGLVAATAAESGVPSAVAPSLVAAVREAADAVKGGRILIYGSLYLAGEVLGLSEGRTRQPTAG